MDDLRGALERLSESGTPVGADAVYERARRRARFTTGSHAPRTSKRAALLSFVAAACVVAVVGALMVSASRDDDRRVAVTNERPREGGSITFGIDAANEGGWCLYESQLDDAGIQVASAIYETLTVPGADGAIHPYLATAVTPNRDATVWTIELRRNITFSDGSPLDALVVKKNLDAYKDQSPFFGLEFADVESVHVVDALTLRVSLARPWSAFPWYLWSNGRLGMMGAHQLDDAATCSTNLIGTGPFVRQSWTRGGPFVAVRNRDYWRTDTQGQRLPYLDRITFVPQPDDNKRLDTLEHGQIDIMQTANAPVIAKIRGAQASTLDAYTPDQVDNVSLTLLNAAKPPFDHLSARRAFAYAIDRDALDRALDNGTVTNASGPFPPGTPGYSAKTVGPRYDLAAARQAAARYREETGRDLTFTISYASGTDAAKTAELLQQMLANAGISMRLAAIADPSGLINIAIARTADAILWQTDVDGDPDLQYSMWHCNNAPPAPCDNPLNFAGFNDPEINRALDKGRADRNPAARREDYERVNKQFASQVWAIWQQWIPRATAFAPDVHGIPGPDLPDDAAPSPGLGSGVAVLGIWTTRH